LNSISKVAEFLKFEAAWPAGRGHTLPDGGQRFRPQAVDGIHASPTDLLHRLVEFVMQNVHGVLRGAGAVAFGHDDDRLVVRGIERIVVRLLEIVIGICEPRATP
jgi:hypothetical protein